MRFVVLSAFTVSFSQRSLTTNQYLQIRCRVMSSLIGAGSKTAKHAERARQRR
jgi:hypothetical protein